jgi:hypothetical protein
MSEYARLQSPCDMLWHFMSSWPACVQSLDVFMAGDDVDKKKPDPMIYRIAAERLNVDPKHCLVVEDSTIGLQVLRRPLSLVPGAAFRRL